MPEVRRQKCIQACPKFGATLGDVHGHFSEVERLFWSYEIGYGNRLFVAAATFTGLADHEIWKLSRVKIFGEFESRGEHVSINGQI